MATKTVRFQAPTGLSSVTAEVYSQGSDTIINTGGDSCTEATNRKGMYEFSFTEANSAGTHLVVVKVDSSPMWPNQWVYFPGDTAGTYYCEDSKGAVEALKPTVIGRTLDVTATGAAGVDWGNVENASATVGLTGTEINYCELVNETAGIGTNALDDTAITAAAVTKIQTGLATATAVSTVDTVVDAIKAVTDLLPDAGALTSLATASALATVDSNVDAILEDTGTTLPATLSTIAGYIDTEIASLVSTIGVAGAGLTAIPWNAAWDAEVQSEAADALAAYDPPTKAEMDSAFTEIKGATWSTTDTLEAIRDRGDAAWVTATGFSTHSAADVWSAGTRTLTAGTNIVLAKGTGVTGFNDLDAAGVRTAVGLASANLDTQLADIPTVSEFEARTLVAASYATATNLATVDTVVDGIKAVTDALPDAGALTSLATAAALTAVDGVVDAIKVTTDKLDDTLELDSTVYRFTTNALEQAPTGGSAPSAADIRAEIDANSTQLAAILADTAEIGAAGAGLTAVPWNASWDAEVQSEVTDALNAYDPPTNAELEARTLLAASYATAANQTTIAGYLDTEIAAILAAVDTEVAAIKAKTDNLPASPAATGDAMTLTSNERNAVADAVLTRSASNVEDTAGEHSLCYVILASSEFSVSGTSLTVKKTDGTTFATKTLTKTEGDDPIRGIN